LSKFARSIEGMLQALLWQLMYQVPQSAVSTVVERFQGIRSDGRKTWLESELRVSLIEIIQLCPKIRVCLFVDALDEYEGEDAKIADYLRSLEAGECSLPINARLCISSRPYPDFNAEFGTSMGFKVHERTTADIQEYVRHRCENFKSHQQNGLSQYLMKRIIEKAQGSFLWTRLVCDDLQKGSRHYRSSEDLDIRLNTTPNGLIPFYQRILDEVATDEQDEEDFHNMCSIVTASEIPLTSWELCYAIEHKRNRRVLHHAHHGAWGEIDKLIRIMVSDGSETEEMPVDWIAYSGLKDWNRFTRPFYERAGTEAFDGSHLVDNDFLIYSLLGGRDWRHEAVRERFWRQRSWSWFRGPFRSWNRSSTDVISALRRGKRTDLYGNEGILARETRRREGFGFSNHEDREDELPKDTPLVERMKVWCKNRVELSGRGFLAVDSKSNEVRMAHETIITFWRDTSSKQWAAQGYELLLVACASCLVAVGRRYPALAHRKGSSRASYHANLAASDSIYEHVFGRLALGHLDTDRSRGNAWTYDLEHRDPQVTSWSLPKYVRQAEMHCIVDPATLLQCLQGIPLDTWLATYKLRESCGVQVDGNDDSEKQCYNYDDYRYQDGWPTLRIPSIFERLSPQSLSLAFLIFARCKRSANAIISLANRSHQKTPRDRGNMITPSRPLHAYFPGEPRLAQDTVDVGREAVHIEIDDAAGFLLCLTAVFGDDRMLSGLHELGAKVNLQLPLAFSALHRAIECNNVDFVRQFLRLYCDQAHRHAESDYLSANDKISALIRDCSHQTCSFLDDDFHVLSEVGFQQCRRVMYDLTGYTKLVSEPSPLTFALNYRREDIVVLLLKSYPAWENLFNTSQSALVEATWFNWTELVKTLLQVGSMSRESLGPHDYVREDLEYAVLAAIHQGHCDILDALLQASTSPARAARVWSNGTFRIQLRTANIPLSPLHLALHMFRDGDRNVEVSKGIVTSLKAHEAMHR
jgi:hypothetical protein